MKSDKHVLVTTALTGFIRAFLLDDINILQSMGFTVHCAANPEGDDYTLQEINEYFHNRGVIFHPISFSSSKPLDKNNIKAYKAFKKVLKEQDFYAIHIHTPIPGVLCRVAIATKKKKYKVLYTTHGFYFHAGSSKKTWFLFRNIESIMSLLTDAMITINREDYHNANKMHCRSVNYINGVGVDTNKYRNVVIQREEYRNQIGLNQQDIALLSVGELSPRKNHQIIIRALQAIGNPNLVYVICGKIVPTKGTYEELKVLADKLNVRVLFLGYRIDIPQIAKSCDIGALPSTREGLGLAGIEMMAAGLPLVASNVHGIKDYVINGTTGFTANPYSETDFADAIQKLMDKRIRQSMEMNCINKAEEFCQEVSHSQRVRIYKEQLGRIGE